MFQARRAVQNPAVARVMNSFFRDLASHGLGDYSSDGRPLAPGSIAKHYGGFLWGSKHRKLVSEKKMSRSRFYVGLSVEDADFESITKRAALISDTLLLSHGGGEEFHALGKTPSGRSSLLTDATQETGMHCSNISGLGEWIMDSESLLKRGLVWYLPSYSYVTTTTDGIPQWSDPLKQATAFDYLVKDRRVIDASGAEPIKSKLVRPIMQVDLPFIEGVSLREFSRITADEFESYRAFRNFLRGSLLRLDDAITCDQSDRELTLIGLEIEDQIRAMRSEMKKVRRRRAVAVTGASIAAVSAALVAVYGPDLKTVLAALGSGGVWGILQARAENSNKDLQEEKWFYVWALARQANMI